MHPSDPESRAAILDTAIAALQAQRDVLGDALVDSALLKLHEQARSQPAEAGAQQLRQVSILFADVVGSTALSQTLDPEDVQAVMDAALAGFSAVVQDHGGRVLQYAGDSMLAVFGAPSAHEDDAERAVQAGLAILAEGRAQAAGVKQRWGHAGFDVRVGIHTGDVLLGGGVDSNDGSIRGVAVNIAARMEQSAPAGMLRISQHTYRQVRGRFELLEQAPLQVKGIDEPLLTYLVQSARAPAQRRMARGVDGVNARMVGRQSELAQLQQAHQRLCGGAGLTLLTVVGEAGLGKSRLLSEFEHWAIDQVPQAAQTRWLQACGGEALINRPYWTLRQLLCDGDAAQPAGARAGTQWLDRVAPLLASRADAAVLGHLLGFDFSAEAEVHALLGEARQLRDRGFFHAGQLLWALAGQARPLLIALDDLHWVDDGTLDFIDYLLASQPELPLLIVGLARPSLQQRRSAWSSQRRIELVPLDADQAEQLVAELLVRLRQMPAGLSELITAQADGNPFYMEELVNMLIDRRAIVTDASEWEFQAERLQALAVPGSLVGVLQARLDALPAAERHTSQLAAVIGFRFWDDCLRQLGAELPETLMALLTRELIAPQQPSSLGRMEEFSFKHHTLHQVAYAGVLKRVKRALHVQVAAWLAALPGDTPLDLVAEHYERGGATTLALDYWQRAAEAAASRYANQQALMHADRALALADHTDLARRYALTLLRCRVLELLCERERLAAELGRLQALAEAQGLAAKRCEALVRRARFCFDGGDIEPALAYARQAVAQAPPDHPASSATAHALVAQCLLRLGDHGQASSVSAEALRLARLAGDAAIEGIILNDLGMRADIAGDHGAAFDCYERALRCHRQVGNRNNEGGTLSNLAYAALVLGEYEAAYAQFELARELFAKIGSPNNEGVTLINMGIARLNQARPAEAQGLAGRALHMLQAAGDRWAAGAALRLSGQAALALGDGPNAIAQLSASLDLFEAMGMPHLAIEARAGLADAALAQADLAGALAHIDAVLSSQAGGISLDGSEEPMRVHLICYRVLTAAADARAPALLDDACQSLLARAALISDPLRRQRYLGQVPYHRELLTLNYW